jgi:hypothetical protein
MGDCPPLNWKMWGTWKKIGGHTFTIHYDLSKRIHLFYVQAFLTAIVCSKTEVEKIKYWRILQNTREMTQSAATRFLVRILVITTSENKHGWSFQGTIKMKWIKLKNCQMRDLARIDFIKMRDLHKICANRAIARPRCNTAYGILRCGYLEVRKPLFVQ